MRDSRTPWVLPKSNTGNLLMIFTLKKLIRPLMKWPIVYVFTSVTGLT